MSLATLPKTLRTIARVRAIVQVLSKHGFGHVVERLQLGRYVPSADWFRRGKPVEETEIDPLVAIGHRLVRVCEELGPTFIKLGQIASTRSDIFPPQILAALERLQDDVSPFPPEQARRIFRDDTGVSVDDAFKSFTAAPFASGSIAQVHRATTKDGVDVVVKIKRPDIEQTIQLDIYVLQWMAERADAMFPEMRPYRPKMVVDEFAQTIRRELDFINEASATARFHEAFRDDPRVATPDVRWDLTGSAVLTLEYMDGVHLHEALERAVRPDNGQLPPGAFDRKALARTLAECFLRQIFEIGLFHADPHPGNLLFRPPSSIVLYDFGMVGQLDDEFVGRLVIGIVATIRREVDVIVEVLADMGAVGRTTDREMLAADLRHWLEKYYGLPLHRLELGTIFHELVETVRRNDVTLPRDFVALFKSLSTVSGVVLQIDPDLNLVELMQPKISSMLRDRLSTRRLFKMARMSAWHFYSIARDAPRLIRDVLRGMGRGQFQVNIKHENLDYLANEMDRSSNRIAFGLLAASTIIGSSMLLSMETDSAILGIPIRYFGFVGYALSFVMSAGLLIAILRSGKMS
jgi:ubiquinone biosynthesis protein